LADRPGNSMPECSPGPTFFKCLGYFPQRGAQRAFNAGAQSRREAGGGFAGAGLRFDPALTIETADLAALPAAPASVLAGDGRGRYTPGFAAGLAIRLGGTIVIDTFGSVAQMRQARELIEAEFKRHDYAFVINTHDHIEHLGGNGAFPNGWIIARQGIAQGLANIRNESPGYIANTEKNIARLEQKLGTLPPGSPERDDTTGQIAVQRAFVDQVRAGCVPPNVTFGDRMTLDLGDRTVVLISVGKGHSYADTFVYVPEDGVLPTGGRGHLRMVPPGVGDLAETADFTRLIAVLSEFVDSDRELRHIISGHMDPVTKADLKFIRDYYQAILEGLRQAQAGGQTLEQAQGACSLAAKLRDWPRLANPTDAMIKQHERNLQRLWTMLGRDR